MRVSARLTTVVAFAMALLAGACGGGKDADTTIASDLQKPGGAVSIAVLSSPARYVSGGDARIGISAPSGLLDKLEVWINGVRSDAELVKVGDGLQAVITGMNLGDNRVEVRHRRGQGQGGNLAAITLTNYPVTGPIWTGPQQTPFVCTTIQSAVARQPKVDATSPPGYRVTDAQGNLIGYSRDCGIDTFIAHHYRNTSGVLQPMPTDGSRPADMSTVTLADGRTVDLVIRREIGSINRFLYSIAMLAPADEDSTKPDTSYWNGKLLYWFQGGVAIGHTQGTVHGGSVNLDILGLGYAIVHSSGNNTGTHYNLQLAGETAMMTKERFIERYGVPAYTVGLGGSGGAIQQYVISQNQPGILDALLPVQSYPDMVTQTIHVGDCELLEYFMDATDRGNLKWRVTKNRSWLVGFNAERNPPGGPNEDVNDPLAGLKALLGYSTAIGSTECVASWRGLTPLAMNPLYGAVPNQELYEPQSDIAAIRWTHYDDLRNIYGVDATGAARPTWDNVGVMYGLQALKAGFITGEEFTHLNFNVGGWKHPSQMVQEGFPFLGTLGGVFADPTTFDPWSSRNMNSSPGPGLPAPRTEGSFEAQRAAYTSGHVFGGMLDRPTIDHRQYMERELDMHNTHQSFVTRQRILDRMGHHDAQVIWFTDTVPGTPKASNSFDAIAVMDQWMANIRTNPDKSIRDNRPSQAVDSCFDVQGQLIYAGDDAWNGILDAKPAGPCTLRFPLYKTSRIVAGAPLAGAMYRCALKPVDQALIDGTFAPWVPSADQLARLKLVFPSGVCDYTRPDQAKP